MKQIPPAELARMFTCDPSTGAIYRDGRRVDFKDGRYRRVYVICADGESRYFAHRVLWCLVHGAWPVGRLDHEDGDGQRNVIGNLRPCTQRQNLYNKAVLRSSLTGFKGVKKTPYGKFNARIRESGREVYLGTFEDPKDAAIAYALAASRIQGQFMHSSVAQTLQAASK